MHKITKRLLLVTTRQYNYLIRFKTTTTPTGSSSSFNDFLKHNQILIKNNNNNSNNNNSNSNNKTNNNIDTDDQYIKIYNEKQLIKRNQNLKDKVINKKINSNGSTERMISNVVYIVNDKKEITTKVYGADSGYNFLEINRFHLDITIPKITLNSIYYKYAQMVKEEVDLETIKKEAKKDNILVSTSFYNTLIYVYILKLEKEKQINGSGSNGDGSSIDGHQEIENIYRYIYKPDRTTFLLKILSLAKNCDGTGGNGGESLREYIQELIKGPNSYLVCLDGFLMSIQTFYNLKNYKMVVTVYREFVHHHSFLNENEHWYSGIIVHSMYQDRCSAEEILGVLNKSNLYYSKQTQFHFNCLAEKYMEENSVIEAWNILQKLYLNDLEYSYNLPIKIINYLQESEQRELTLKMYPLLMAIYKDASKSKRSLVRTLLESCGEQGTHVLNNLSLLNPLSDDYILCKKSIESIQIDPTPSILGIKIPTVPKHQRVTRNQRIYDKRLGLFVNDRSGLKKEFFDDISNLGDHHKNLEK